MAEPDSSPFSELFEKSRLHTPSLHMGGGAGWTENLHPRVHGGPDSGQFIAKPGDRVHLHVPKGHALHGKQGRVTGVSANKKQVAVKLDNGAQAFVGHDQVRPAAMSSAAAHVRAQGQQRAIRSAAASAVAPGLPAIPGVKAKELPTKQQMKAFGVLKWTAADAKNLNYKGEHYSLPQGYHVVGYFQRAKEHHGRFIYIADKSGADLHVLHAVPDAKGNWNLRLDDQRNGFAAYNARKVALGHSPSLAGAEPDRIGGARRAKPKAPTPASRTPRTPDYTPAVSPRRTGTPPLSAPRQDIGLKTPISAPAEPKGLEGAHVTNVRPGDIIHMPNGDRHLVDKVGLYAPGRHNGQGGRARGVGLRPLGDGKDKPLMGRARAVGQNYLAGAKVQRHPGTEAMKNPEARRAFLHGTSASKAPQAPKPAGVDRLQQIAENERAARANQSALQVGQRVQVHAPNEKLHGMRGQIRGIRGGDIPNKGVGVVLDNGSDHIIPRENLKRLKGSDRQFGHVPAKSLPSAVSGLSPGNRSGAVAGGMLPVFRDALKRAGVHGNQRGVMVGRRKTGKDAGAVVWNFGGKYIQFNANGGPNGRGEAHQVKAPGSVRPRSANQHGNTAEQDLAHAQGSGAPKFSRPLLPHPQAVHIAPRDVKVNQIGKNNAGFHSDLKLPKDYQIVGVGRVREGSTGVANRYHIDVQGPGGYYRIPKVPFKYDGRGKLRLRVDSNAHENAMNAAEAAQARPIANAPAGPFKPGVGPFKPGDRIKLHAPGRQAHGQLGHVIAGGKPNRPKVKMDDGAWGIIDPAKLQRTDAPPLKVLNAADAAHAIEAGPPPAGGFSPDQVREAVKALPPVKDRTRDAAFLKGKITNITSFHGGVSQSFRAEIGGKRVYLKARFTAAQIRRNHGRDRIRSGITPGKDPEREVLGSRIADELRVFGVAHSHVADKLPAFRGLDTDTFGVQTDVGGRAVGDFSSRGPAFDRDLRRVALLDHVIGNTDRHGNNAQVKDVDGVKRLIPIDHSLAFPEGPSDSGSQGAAQKFLGARLSLEEVALLHQLRGNKSLLQDLQRELGAGAANSLIHRLDKMLKTGRFLQTKAQVSGHLA